MGAAVGVSADYQAFHPKTVCGKLFGEYFVVAIAD